VPGHSSSSHGAAATLNIATHSTVKVAAASCRAAEPTLSVGCLLRRAADNKSGLLLDRASLVDPLATDPAPHLLVCADNRPALQAASRLAGQRPDHLLSASPRSGAAERFILPN
jgi:hypothetical protein